MAEAITAAIVGATSAAALACISRSRCRFLVSKNGTSFGIGFSEVPLPLPSPTNQELARNKNVMKLLELFCGTKSIGKAFEDQGWSVVSVDANRKTNPTIYTDIMDFHFKAYAPYYFQHVHASPPCTEYSRAKTVGVRKLWLADTIAKKTL